MIGTSEKNLEIKPWIEGELQVQIKVYGRNNLRWIHLNNDTTIFAITIL